MISYPIPAALTTATRVAVLDDDIRFIRMVERILHTQNIAIEPITTMDIDEAIAVIASTGCNAAIVDVYMYGSQQGFTLVERLRSDPATAELPIIVASGARREIGKRVSFLQEHRCDILLKPFGVDDLLRKFSPFPPPALPPATTVPRM